MKSTIAKCALALSVLGFTFGSNVVYDSQWSPSIFRTIANAVEFESVTEENVQTELDKLKEMISSSKESNDVFKAKLDNEETVFSELIVMRDEELESVKESVAVAFTRSGDFSEFFADKPEHALKGDFEALSQDIGDIKTAPYTAKLNDKIAIAQEKELLEQKAAIAVANERICENKGLLVDIKEKLAALLKDKEEVVAEVEAEETQETDGFSADVLTYADFFAQIQRQQSSFFEVSAPSFLAPTNDPMSMFMMMTMMNNRQNAAPRSQVNTYHIGGSAGGYGYPGIGFGIGGGFPTTSLGGDFGFQEQDYSLRTPAANSMPRLMPSFGGTTYTQTIPKVNRGNGMQGSFNF